MVATRSIAQPGSRHEGSFRACSRQRCCICCLRLTFFLLLYSQMIGKFTAGMSETSPTSIPMEDLSWQRLGASLAASGAASPVSRARCPQETRQSEQSAFLQRSFRKGCVKPPLFQQPPLQGAHNSCSGEGSADFFFHSKRRWGRWEEANFFFFSAFSCTKGSLFILIAGSLTQQSALSARQQRKTPYAATSCRILPLRPSRLLSEDGKLDP